MRVVDETERLFAPLRAELEFGALEERREAEESQDEARLQSLSDSRIVERREEARDVDEAEPVERYLE